MKNKFVLVPFLFSTLCLLHGMELDVDKLSQIQNNLKLIKEVFTKSPRPNETRVSMWEAQSISTKPTIESPLTISTTGLIGCIATTLHVTYNNGDQYAGMTHYPPTSHEHNNAVKNLCLQALNNQNESKKIVATHFFFSASENTETTPVYELLSAQEKETKPLYHLLSNTVHTTLKETGAIKTQLVPYDIPDLTNLTNLFLDNNTERDIEMILFPDKATLKIKNQTIYLNSDYSIKLVTGNAVEQFLPFVSTQVITAFKEYPYLYDGNYEEEMDFRKSLAQHQDTAIAVAYHKEIPIGFLTGYTFVNFSPHFEGCIELFKEANLNPEEFYYFGEIIILPEHRGNQVSNKLFNILENHVKNDLGYKKTCIVTEEHESHPLKPNNYKSLNPLWNFLGYQKTSLVLNYPWQTHQPDGSVIKDKHPLTYWIKTLL